MAKQTFELELDRSGIAKTRFDRIKNDLVKDLIKEAWTPERRLPGQPDPRNPGAPNPNPVAFHVKTEFDKHIKGKISIGRGAEDPTLDTEAFNPDSPMIERIKVTVEDI
jgi:hypothetical protein